LSQENFRLFLEAVAKDESLEAKLAAIGDKYHNQDLDESKREALWMNEVIPLARSHGYDFTIEDLRAFHETMTPKPGKLADEELNLVVGGGICVCVVGGGGGGTGYTECSCMNLGRGWNEDRTRRCFCLSFGFGQD